MNFTITVNSAKEEYTYDRISSDMQSVFIEAKQKIDNWTSMVIVVSRNTKEKANA